METQPGLESRQMSESIQAAIHMIRSSICICIMSGKTCVAASVGSITAMAQSPLSAGSPRSLLAVLSPQLADAESLERLAESLALLQPSQIPPGQPNPFTQVLPVDDEDEDSEEDDDATMTGEGAAARELAKAEKLLEGFKTAEVGSCG